MTAAAPQGRQRRLAARGFGRRGEWRAMIALLLRGYRIVARNLRTPVGEIDLVAARGRTVVFVEVKARRELETARTAITATQRLRVARAAGWWLARNPWAQGYDLRGDAIFVGALSWPVHIEDAFPLGLHTG